MKEKAAHQSRIALIAVFLTVALDLVGFGIVVPLVALYGHRFAASTLQLSVLGAAYSVMQFLFSPLWGVLSDRWGRRPILLISLFGSTSSYFLFGIADSYHLLLTSRLLAGFFAANISVAQSYIADLTEGRDRVKGMGLIGAAFGIGFTLGPPIGGIAAKEFGLGAPGLIAGALCGMNFLLAWLRLPESLAKTRETVALHDLIPFHPRRLALLFSPPMLALLVAVFFAVTFAFSNIEQVFALFFHTRLHVAEEVAGYQTGMLLMWMSVVGVVMQGGVLRLLLRRYDAWQLLCVGLLLHSIALITFPLCHAYVEYCVVALPLSIGSSLINPNLSALITLHADSSRYGAILGVSQGFASLARALGPFSGLLLFSYATTAPFFLAGGISTLLFVTACYASRAAGLRRA